MRRGFNVLPWGESLKRFTAADMLLLLCGPSTIDAEQVIANIDFSYGNWQGSKTLDHICQHLRTLSEADLRNFLKFVTGSPSLPHGGLGAGGMASNQPAGKICFTRLPNSQRLPEAHTCFNSVDLPDYNDLAMLQEKLRQAIDNDDGKFDIL